jgi:hypothetical protein
MSRHFDIIAQVESENFRLTPISSSAREYFDLKFGCGTGARVESVELDPVAMAKFIRWCDGAGYRILAD